MKNKLLPGRIALAQKRITCYISKQEFEITTYLLLLIYMGVPITKKCERKMSNST